MNKWLRFGALCLAAALLVMTMAACGGSDTSGGGADKKLLIGGIGPLTGDYANYGTSVKQGAEIALKEINEAGGVNGYQLDLRFEDSKANDVEAVNAYNTLMDADMKVLLGTVLSGPCIAVAEESKKDGILMLTPSGSQKECTQYDNAFRVCFNDPQQGTVSADYIADHMPEVQSVAILYESSNSYSAGIVEMFEAEAAVKNLTIATKQAFTSTSNTSFSAQLQAIKDSDADLIFLPIYASDAAKVLTQAQTAGVELPFFGCDGLDGVIGELGDKSEVAEGVMLLTPFVADAEDELTTKFVSAYKAAYNGQTPDQFAADGYDGMYAIKAALEKAAIEDPTMDVKEMGDKLIAAMTQITVKGTTGEMTWSADGECQKEAKAMVIQNGVYVAL